jgi:hypothetical protein
MRNSAIKAMTSIPSAACTGVDAGVRAMTKH